MVFLKFKRTGTTIEQGIAIGNNMA